MRRWLSSALACALAFAGVLAPASPARALSVRAMTPEQVAEAAAVVVVARVERVGVETTSEGAVTETLRLDVRETWKGTPRPVRRLRQFIGHRGASGLRIVAGLPRLLPGHSYLLFLPPEGARPSLPATVGGEQGAFEAEAAAGGWLFRSLDGRCLVGLTDAHLVFETPPAVSPAGRMLAGDGVTLRQRPTTATLPTSSPREVAERWRALTRAVRP